MDIEFLEEKARQLRIESIKMIHTAKSGHPGGSLSIADIMAVLYFDEMNVDVNNPEWEDRDRFILSKGHTCPVWYSALALKGFFPACELATLRKLESHLQGHPDMKKVRGIDMTTGSLGNGLGIGVGMAKAAKIGNKSYRVYVAVGDGEVQEGAIWEAAMSAAHYRLDNLVVIVDKNNLQVDGFVNEIMGIDPIDEKFKAFGFEVTVIDGHDIRQICEALTKARQVKGKPFCIIANTTKGKGVSYMENECSWHGTAPNDEQYDKAMRELGGAGI
ncbi:MAG: transketolase [Clostridia bacterium]|nr:transketolase [Clostridia bacterium]